MNLPMYLREADSLKKREAGLSTTSNKERLTQSNRSGNASYHRRGGLLQAKKNKQT